MTEYTATCDYRAADKIRAVNDGEGKVAVRAYEGGSFRVAYLLRPDVARTFARGILALADEIDGGEAPLKVGDRVRVVDAAGNSDFEGKTGTIKRLNGGSRLPYHVEFGDGQGGHGESNGQWNCKTVVRADEAADVAPEPTPRKVKVGDKLRVTEDGLYDAEVSVGDVLTVEFVSSNGDDFETAGDGWVFKGHHIGDGLEFVYGTVPAPVPADEPVKVGDRVVIVKDDDSIRTGEFVGKAGTVERIYSSGRLRYGVTFPEGTAPHESWNVAEVRKSDESGPEAAPTSVASSRRLAALKEAQQLIDDGLYDVSTIAVARFLLGE